MVSNHHLVERVAWRRPADPVRWSTEIRGLVHGSGRPGQTTQPILIEPCQQFAAVSPGTSSCSSCSSCRTGRGRAAVAPVPPYLATAGHHHLRLALESYAPPPAPPPPPPPPPPLPVRPSTCNFPHPRPFRLGILDKDARDIHRFPFLPNPGGLPARPPTDVVRHRRHHQRCSQPSHRFPPAGEDPPGDGATSAGTAIWLLACNSTAAAAGAAARSDHEDGGAKEESLLMAVRHRRRR